MKTGVNGPAVSIYVMSLLCLAERHHNEYRHRRSVHASVARSSRISSMTHLGRPSRVHKVGRGLESATEEEESNE